MKTILCACALLLLTGCTSSYKPDTAAAAERLNMQAAEQSVTAKCHEAARSAGGSMVVYWQCYGREAEVTRNAAGYPFDELDRAYLKAMLANATQFDNGVITIGQYADNYAEIETAYNNERRKMATDAEIAALNRELASQRASDSMATMGAILLSQPHYRSSVRTTCSQTGIWFNCTSY
jgi:hypothetical protein